MWGADRSFFLVNGSSSGNHAYLLAAAGPGDEVIVGRDLRKSLLVGLILTGARPVYVAGASTLSSRSASGWPPRRRRRSRPPPLGPRLVTLVSPSHDGVATTCRASWPPPTPAGARLRRRGLGPAPQLPSRAPRRGAGRGRRRAVTSTHKILSSLSQTSVLNVRAGLVDPAQVAATVRMTQTTSPLLALLASLDACRRQLATDGERLLGRAVELAGDARRRLRMLPGLDVLGPDRLGLAADRFDRSSWSSTCVGRAPRRISPSGCCGTASPSPRRQRPARRRLHGDHRRHRHSVDQLVGAFAALAAQHQAGPSGAAPAPALRAGSIPVQALTPREAFFAPSRTVPLAERRQGRRRARGPLPAGDPGAGPRRSDRRRRRRPSHGLPPRPGPHLRPADPTLDRVAVVDGS